MCHDYKSCIATGGKHRIFIEISSFSSKHHDIHAKYEDIHAGVRIEFVREYIIIFMKTS